MKRTLLMLVTAAAFFGTGFVLYRSVREPVQAASPSDPVPAAYRDNQQFHGSSFHYCLRGRS
jgi:hypothetical protein